MKRAALILILTTLGAPLCAETTQPSVTPSEQVPDLEALAQALGAIPPEVTPGGQPSPAAPVRSKTLADLRSLAREAAAQAPQPEGSEEEKVCELLASLKTGRAAKDERKACLAELGVKP